MTRREIESRPREAAVKPTDDLVVRARITNLDPKLFRIFSVQCFRQCVVERLERSASRALRRYAANLVAQAL